MPTSQRNILLILSIVAFAAISCSPYPKVIKTTDLARQISTEYQEKLPEQSSQFYSEVYDKRIEYYTSNLYRTGLSLDYLESYSRLLENYEFANQHEEDSVNDRIAFLQNEYQKLDKANAMAGDRLIESASGLNRLLTDYDINSKLICKLRDNGRVQCMEVSSLLAMFDAYMGELIVNDIRGLYDFYDFDPSDRILFECGDGYWGSISENDLMQRSPNEHSFEERFTYNAVDLCEQITSAIENNKSEHLQAITAQLFSGVTGLDPLGLFDCYNPSFDGMEYFNNLVKDLEEFDNKCESNFIQTFTKGEADTQLDLVPPPSSASKTSEKVVDNGDGTETVTVTINGQTYEYVRYRTNTPDGQVTTRYSDSETGNSWTVTETPGVVTTWEEISERGKKRIWTWEEPDGTHIRSLEYKKDKNGKWKWKRYRLGGGGWMKVKSCVDDVNCSYCESWVTNLPPILGGGGSSWSGRQYLARGGECCSGNDILTADPKLVIPDPNGDFICTGDATLDAAQLVCERKCTVASDPNCMSNCTERKLSGKESSNIIGDVCGLYGMSEDCFIGEFHVDPFWRGPGFEPDSAPSPQPIPTLVRSHLLFPPPMEIEFFDFLLPDEVSDPQEPRFSKE